MSLELAAECPPPGEDAAIREIVDRMAATLERTYPPHDRPMRRAVHTKDHGCVTARFVISESVPARLRFGIFAAPRTFDAIVRFSNSTPELPAENRKPQSDTNRDLRGMAVKLTDVTARPSTPGETNEQDFLLASHPAFFHSRRRGVRGVSQGGESGQSTASLPWLESASMENRTAPDLSALAVAA